MQVIKKYLPIIYGCHQRSDRSFSFRGQQFPICARCTGMFIGNIFAIVFAFFNRTPIFITFLMMIPMIIDGSIQAKTSYESNNITRVITGFLGGVGGALLLIELGVLVYNWGYKVGIKIKN